MADYVKPCDSNYGLHICGLEQRILRWSLPENAIRLTLADRD